MEWGNLLLTLLFHLCYSGGVDGAQPVGKCSGDPQQLQKRADCVCSSHVLVDYFSEAIRISPSMSDKAAHVISERMKHFSCYEFIQLPSHLQIEMSDSVPTFRKRRLFTHRKRYRVKRDLLERNTTYHRRTKRQISLGFPTDEKWEKTIPQLPKQGRHYYAPIGSEVTLKCYAGHDGTDQTGVIDQVDDASRQFEWKHANGMEITAPYVTIDKITGDLKFHTVRLADTGIYTCTIKSAEDQALREKGRFQSQLDVVAGPTQWLRFGMTYTVSSCRHKELMAIQRKVPDLVHQYVCHFCSVMNVSMTCIGLGRGGGSKDEKIVQLTVGLSPLGFERLLPSWNHYHMYWDLECQARMHAKVLSVTTESLVKLFNLPIYISVNNRRRRRQVEQETSIYNPIPDSYEEDIADGCPPGFFLTYSLCFPCPPGRYSPTGPADCFPCAKGFFQPNPGSSACFHCPKGHTTPRKGSLSQMDCVLESASSWMQFFQNHLLIVMCVGVALVLLILLMILICCCWPQSAVGRCVRCVPCCGESDGIEKEIPEDRENLLRNEETSTSEFESDEEIFRRKGKRRASRYDGDGDFRSSEKSEGTLQADNVTVAIVSEDISTEKLSPLRKPKRLDLSKFALKRPIVPFPFRRGPCHATLRSRRQQERELLEEQQQRQQVLLEDGQEESFNEDVAPPPLPPPLPPSSDDDEGTVNNDENHSETSESSKTKRFLSLNPHLKLGNVLRKSKSFVNKLAEQRHKLRQNRKTASASKLGSSASESFSGLKNKTNNKMVTISESNNTYHPPGSCKKCSTISKIFTKSKNKDKQQQQDNTRSKLLSRASSKLDRFRTSSSERVKNTVKQIQDKLNKKRKR